MKRKQIMSEIRDRSNRESPPKPERPESTNAEDKVNDALEERQSADVRIDSPDRAVKMHDPPAVFQILQKKNTNLNEPPSNWLYGSSRWQSRLHQTSFPFDNFFSSFNMANSFLNMTGIVDVISDSQNIKKLLKMTLSKANISMVVHRVNNTLLLDNLDIHSLLRQKDGDWEIFRKFYYDIVTEDVKLPVVERKNKSRDYLQSRNMFSKLLYYCLAGEQSSPDSQSNISNSECGSNDLSPRTVVWNFEDIRMLIGTDLPIFGRGSHPCVSVKLRDMNKPISVLTGLDNWLDNLMCNVPELAMCYHDNGIIQSYEVLKTEDIPNCSDFKFSPSVIKDIAQNILSFLKSNATKEGHTYWLFKAHEGDIVKLYDLTTLCNNNDDNITVDNKSEEPTTNPFTTPVGNLLYRLTVNLRCKQTCPSRGKKVPVIRKLLKNCISLFDSSKNYQMVTTCHYFLSDLFVCDHLEEPELQSESSESDVEDNDSMENNSSNDEDEEEEKKMARNHKNKSQLIEEATSSIKVQSLTAHKQPGKKKSTNNKKKKKSSKSPSLHKCTSSTAEVKNDDKNDDFMKRSSRALKHIERALSSLEKYHPSPSKSGSSCSARGLKKEKISKQFEELKQCNPNEAIPLHYTPLKPQSQTNQRGKDFNEGLSNSECSENGKEVCERNFSLSRVLKDIESPFASKAINTDLWHRKPRIFFLRKTCIVFLKRSKSRLMKSELVTSIFHDGDKALRCYCAFGRLVNVTSSSDLYFRCQHDPDLFISIVTTLGDAYLQAAHVFMQGKSFKDEIMEEEDFEKDLLSRMAESLSDIPFDVEIPKDAEHSFEKSLKCYLLAEEVMEKYMRFIDAKKDKGIVKSFSQLSKSLNEIRRRQANAYNEYGKHYFMQVVSPNGALNPNWETVMVTSQKYYMKSFKIFMLINDRLNAALVMANDCNVTRQRAHMIRKLAVEGSLQFSPEEEELYKMAEICYGTILKLLKSRESFKETWDVIQWELVTMHVNVASLLQDNPPIDTKPADEIIKEVIVKFTETLERCQFEPSSSKYVPALYRRAHIHHRLASLYQKTFLNAKTKSEMRENKQAAEKHHRYAYDIFVSIDSGCELIRLQLERIGLSENCLSMPTNDTERIKIFERTVELLLQCRQPMKVVVSMSEEILSKLSRQESLKDGSSQTMSASSMSEFSNDIESITEMLKLSEILQSKLSSTFLALLHIYKKRSEDGAFNFYKSMYQKCITSESGRFDWSSACTYWKMFSKCMTNFFLDRTVNAKNESKNECTQMSGNESCTYLSMLQAILLQLISLSDFSHPIASVKETETALQEFYVKLKCLSSVSTSILTILEEVQRSKNFRKM